MTDEVDGSTNVRNVQLVRRSCVTYFRHKLMIFWKYFIQIILSIQNQGVRCKLSVYFVANTVSGYNRQSKTQNKINP